MKMIDLQTQKICYTYTLNSMVSAVLGVFPSERAHKLLKNDVLDAKKLFDIAENEPLQTSKIRKKVISHPKV